MELPGSTWIFFGVPCPGSHFRRPGFWVPLECFEVPDPRSHFGGPKSLVPPRHFGVLRPGGPTCRRPGSRVSLFQYAQCNAVYSCNEYKQICSLWNLGFLKRRIWVNCESVLSSPVFFCFLKKVLLLFLDEG